MPAKRNDSKPGEKLLTLYTLLMLRGERAISLGELAETGSCLFQVRRHAIRICQDVVALGKWRLI